MSAYPLIVALAMLGTASAAKYDKTFEARRPRPTVQSEHRRAEAAPPPP